MTGRVSLAERVLHTARSSGSSFKYPILSRLQTMCNERNAEKNS